MPGNQQKSAAFRRPGNTLLRWVISSTSLSGRGPRALRGVGVIAAAFLVSAATSARAEDGPILTAQATPPSADQGLSSSSSSSSDQGIEDVTVTARRRIEKLQDVPVTISVLNGDEWADKGGKSIETIQLSVPNVSMNLSNPRQTQTAIRGLGMNPAGDGLASSVGYYVDGVYLDRPGMAAIDWFDLKQIEVLKGPQGTLFGKNNTAGALSIQTAPPTFDDQLLLETNFGNYGLRQERAVANGKISDVLAARLSVYDDNHDGYIKDTNEAVPGDQPNNSQRQGARLQFLFEPNPDFNVTWRSDYNIQHDNDGASILYSQGSPAKWASWVAKTGLNPIVGANYITDANASQNMLTRNYGSSIEANWTLDGGYTLTSVSAFRAYNFRPHNDGLDQYSPILENYYSSQGREKEQELTQEIRVASPAGEHLDYVAGLYYLWRRENLDQIIYYPKNWSTLTNSTSNAWLNGATTEAGFDPNTNSYAAFAQSNYHFNKKWTLTTGLRETFEANQETITQYQPDNPAAAVPVGSGPYHSSVGTYSWNLAELVTLSYKPIDNLLTYTTFSHGAKAAGFNTNVPTSGTDTLTVAPETVYNYELGIKGSQPSARLSYDAALFLAKVYNYQSNEREQINGGWQTLILNAGTAQSKGLEADVSWKPITKLKLDASGAWDIAQYKSYRGAPVVQGASGNYQDLSGSRMTNAPIWSGTVSAVYTEPVTDETVAYFGIDYSWKDWQYGYVDDSTYSKISSYGIANLRLGVNLNDRVDVSFFANNVFNTPYFYSVGVSSTGAGYTAAPGEPRVLGVSLKAKI